MSGTPHLQSGRVHPLVRRLGWVSFFTDAATEMLYPLIPAFLTVTLGAPVTALGIVEGAADGVATGLKAGAGAAADRVRRPRLLVQGGYALSALAKPLLAVAPVWGVVACLRVADRAGKAIRGAPRDVLIAGVSASGGRGRAFGFHRMLDSAGAVAGPLVAAAALVSLGEERLRPVFAFAVVPGLASLWLLRRLPDAPARSEERWGPSPLPWRGRFGWFAASTAVFAIGNSSDAFLLLRARDVGLGPVAVILAYALYNVVYSAVSLPAGIRSDRRGRLVVYGSGLLVFAAVYAAFGVLGSPVWVWPLFAVYGVYMGLTDGVGRAIVVDLVPEHVRGKALGVTQAISGGGVLVAGVTAGLLWDRVSPAAPFVVGATTALVASVILAGAKRS